jgi:hypothetical protein
MKKMITLVLLITFGKTQAQNVGIGTANPLAKLHVDNGFLSEAIRLSSDFGPHISFRLSGNDNLSAPLIGLNASVPFQTDFRLSTPAGFNLPIKFFTNDSLRLLITANGKVGVGGIGEPEAAMHINTTASEALRVQAPFAYQTFYNDKNYMGYLQAWTDALAIGSTTGNALRMYVNNGVERLTILANGNTGINNANPQHSLDVGGNLNLNGSLLVNGATGTAGQVLVSNGTAAPTWRSTSFNNPVRFAYSFINFFTGLNPVYTNTPIYNLSTSDVNIGANTITINKSGLYHFDGYVTLFASYSNTPAYQHASVSVAYGNVVIRYMDTEPMRAMNDVFQYRGIARISQDIYITAPAVISIGVAIAFSSAPQSSKEASGVLTGYLISE